MDSVSVKMVRLTAELIARGTSGYTKKKKEESAQHFVKRLTHLYLENKNITEVVNLCFLFTWSYSHSSKTPGERKGEIVS